MTPATPNSEKRKHVAKNNAKKTAPLDNSSHLSGSSLSFGGGSENHTSTSPKTNTPKEQLISVKPKKLTRLDRSGQAVASASSAKPPKKKNAANVVRCLFSRPIHGTRACQILGVMVPSCLTPKLSFTAAVKRVVRFKIYIHDFALSFLLSSHAHTRNAVPTPMHGRTNQNTHPDCANAANALLDIPLGLPRWIGRASRAKPHAMIPRTRHQSRAVPHRS